MITAQSPGVNNSFSVSSLTPPDPTSDEPEDIGTYQGIRVINNQIYLPIILRSFIPQPGAWQFVGSWINEDANTRGITSTQIRSESNMLFVHMWGACSPTDCDWGETSTSIADADDGVLSLTWTFSFKVETQQVSVLSDGRLQVVGHIHYTDNSGRSDTDYTEYFIKE